MSNKVLCLFSLIWILSATNLFAQQDGSGNSESKAIRGTRFIPYPNYSGKPYLFDKFLQGEIELKDGTKISGLGLSYSTYRDELIYYNTKVSAQIQIDKISLKGFSITEPNGRKRIFKRLYCTEYMRDECYFEVLSEGKISLLAFRKVNLEINNTYYSKSGMAYEPAYSYFMYSPGKGFSAINLNRNSLLSRFSKANQKIARKLLRKNGIIIADEPGFIRAWNLIQEKELEINF